MKCLQYYHSMVRIRLPNNGKFIKGERMTSTEELLLGQYRTPLLSLEAVAEIFGRSPNGLRVSLGAGGEVALRLNSARVKLGRRIYFRVADIARLIDEA
jgi:hypothetical protein